MKLCIPVAADQGAASPVFGHFGSAPVFAIHDTDAGSTTFLENANAHHAHGACQPLKALGGQTVDALVVGGIGARAIARLNDQGIRVYRARPGTLAETLDAWNGGTLEEIQTDGGCTQHGGCSH